MKKRLETAFAWLKAHKAVAIVLGLLLLWIVYRMAKGLSVTKPGHASPEDAIAAGWTVWQAGITGWLETSPDSAQAIMHDTGWTGDPFSRA